MKLAYLLMMVFALISFDIKASNPTLEAWLALNEDYSIGTVVSARLISKPSEDKKYEVALQKQNGEVLSFKYEYFLCAKDSTVLVGQFHVVFYKESHQNNISAYCLISTKAAERKHFEEIKKAALANAKKSIKSAKDCKKIDEFIESIPHDPFKQKHHLQNIKTFSKNDFLCLTKMIHSNDAMRLSGGLTTHGNSFEGIMHKGYDKKGEHVVYFMPFLFGKDPYIGGSLNEEKRKQISLAWIIMMKESEWPLKNHLNQ